MTGCPLLNVVSASGGLVMICSTARRLPYHGDILSAQPEHMGRILLSVKCGWSITRRNDTFRSERVNECGQ